MKVIRTAAFILFSLTLGLAMTEIVLRQLRPARPIVERSIRLRENILNTDQMIPVTGDILRYSDTLNKTANRYRVDDDGFVEPSRVHSEADLDIVFLGGSTTECNLVDEETRYPFLVGRILERKLGVKVNAWNHGVSGNHSMHSNDLLINKILPLRPDIAVLHHNINDLSTLLILGTYWNDHFRRSLIEVQDPWTTRGLLKFVRYRLFRSTMDALLSSAALASLTRPFQYRNTDEFAAYRGKQVLTDLEALEKEFRKSLELFIAVCRVHGIEPVLMTQASRLTDAPDPVVRDWVGLLQKDYGVSYELFRSMHRRFNEVVRDVAISHGIALIDAEELVGGKREYLYDIVHYNDEGSRWIASQVAAVLEPVTAKVLKPRRSE